MEKFHEALDRYIVADKAERRTLEKTIWRAYGKQAAVMVLDMSGFSLLTRTQGILRFLGMVRRMQAVTRPVVEGAGGAVVKYEADNLYAVFPEVRNAIEAAIRINVALGAQNFLTEDSQDIHVSIGIAWGEILLIPGKDFYGDAVNIAAKLGEDLAERSEILVDAHALEQLGPASGGFAGTEVDYSISGLDVKAYRIAFRGAGLAVGK